MLPPQDGRLMSQGNELKFQRGTAAKTEFEDRNNGPKNRHHRDGTAGLRKSPALPQPCGILSKDSVGEIGITGTAGAVANAVWHATGVRVRKFPITLDRLIDPQS